MVRGVKYLLVLLSVFLISSIIMTDISADELDDVYYEEYGFFFLDGQITRCPVGVEIVNIPEEIDGIEVTSIGESAFAGCYTLESINIPNTVTSIGDYAFFTCYNLTEV